MPNIAIISDIHSNLEALETVLLDIEEKGFHSILCLGDLVGYGPNPRECVQRAIQFDKTLRGLHEEALLFMSSDFVNPDTQRSISWTREELNSPDYEPKKNQELWSFIGNLEEVEERDRSLFLHGSPQDPTGTPINLEDLKKNEFRTDTCSRFDRLLFCGHTHKPYAMKGNGEVLYPTDESSTTVSLETEDKYIINVGSVGQPRDRDNRACWVGWRNSNVTFHRVEYDFETTMEKIQSIEKLSPFLANRLREGR